MIHRSDLQPVFPETLHSNYTICKRQRFVFFKVSSAGVLRLLHHEREMRLHTKTGQSCFLALPPRLLSIFFTSPFSCYVSFPVSKGKSLSFSPRAPAAGHPKTLLVHWFTCFASEVKSPLLVTPQPATASPSLPASQQRRKMEKRRQDQKKDLIDPKRYRSQ